MLQVEDKQLILRDIFLKKKSLLTMRIKRSSGDVEVAKNMRSTRKEVARLFTKMNAK